MCSYTCHRLYKTNLWEETVSFGLWCMIQHSWECVSIVWLLEHHLIFLGSIWVFILVSMTWLMVSVCQGLLLMTTSSSSLCYEGLNVFFMHENRNVILESRNKISSYIRTWVGEWGFFSLSAPWKGEVVIISIWNRPLRKTQLENIDQQSFLCFLFFPSAITTCSADHGYWFSGK